MKALPLLVVLLALVAPARGTADVTIVRRLPATGDSTAQAQWVAPRPEVPLAPEGPRVTGRLSAGALGGVDSTGETLYGFSTDSQITLVQPLGGQANLRLDASALRKSLVDGTNQAYGGKLAVLGERLNADLEGGYRQSDRIVSGTELTDIDASLKASLTALPVATLPVKLAYQGASNDGSEEAAAARWQSHGLQVSAVGSLGNLGTELSWVLNQATQADGGTESLNTSGRLFFRLPVASFLTLRAGIAPSHSDTTYGSTGNTTRTTSLLSSLGVVVPISESVETYLAGGVVNSWREQQGPSAIPSDGMELALQGEVGANIDNRSGFASGTRYQLARTTAGGLSHGASLNALWQSEQRSLVERAEAAGELTYTTSPSGSVLLDEKKWNLSIAAAPARQMGLTGSYQGSQRREPPSELWQQQATVAFSHDPDPILSYRASFALSGFGANTSEDLLKHESSAAVYLKPQWNRRVGTFGLLETFSVSQGDSGTDLLSKASAVMAVPVTEAVRLGYQLDWEWINRREIGGPPGHALRHEANASFAGGRLPFALSARYAFGHGYRGPRHDSAAQLAVPLRQGYEVRGTFNFSHYLDSGRASAPFLVELELSRSF